MGELQFSHCKICSCKIRFHKSTCTMMNHLKAAHGDVNLKNSGSTNSNNFIYNTSNSKSKPPRPYTNYYPPLDPYTPPQPIIYPDHRYPMPTKERSEEISLAITHFFIQEMLPLKISQKNSFRRLVNQLVPNYMVATDKLRECSIDTFMQDRGLEITNLLSGVTEQTIHPLDDAHKGLDKILRIENEEDEISINNTKGQIGGNQIETQISYPPAPTNIHSISVSWEIWENKLQNKGYLTVYLYHIDSQFNRRRYVLNTLKFPNSFGIVIEDIVTQILNRIGVDTRNLFLNFISADSNYFSRTINPIDFIQIPCFGSVILRCLQGGFEVMEELRGKCRKIANYFRGFQNCPKELKTLENSFTKELFRLRTETEGIANSTFKMLKGIWESKESIVKYHEENQEITQYVIELDVQDWAHLKELYQFLSPFEAIIDMLSTTNNPLISLILPILYNIDTNLLNPKEEDLQFISNVKGAIRSILGEERKLYAPIYHYLCFSSYFDLRFKSLGFLPDLDKEIAINKIYALGDQFYNYLSKKGGGDMDMGMDMDKMQRTQNGISINKTNREDIRNEYRGNGHSERSYDILGEYITGTTNTNAKLVIEENNLNIPNGYDNREHTNYNNPEGTNIDQPDHITTNNSEPGNSIPIQISESKSKENIRDEEFMNYDLESSILLTEDPLHWWKINELKYPFLSQIAKIFLSPNATSVQPSKIFATDSFKYNAKRNIISTKDINQYIFLSREANT